MRRLTSWEIGNKRLVKSGQKGLFGQKNRSVVASPLNTTQLSTQQKGEECKIWDGGQTC